MRKSASGVLEYLLTFLYALFIGLLFSFVRLQFDFSANQFTGLIIIFLSSVAVITSIVDLYLRMSLRRITSIVFLKIFAKWLFVAGFGVATTSYVLFQILFPNSGPIEIYYGYP